MQILCFGIILYLVNLFRLQIGVTLIIIIRTINF